MTSLPHLRLAQQESPGITEQVGEVVEEVAETAGDVVRELPAYGITVVRIAVIILVAWIAHRIIRRIIRRFEQRIGTPDTDVAKDAAVRRAQTLGQVLRGAALAIILTVTVLLVLGQAGIETGPLLAAAGIGGIALGFGAQHLVRDVIGGFFILFEDQYHVGDVIRVADKVGTVEKISLRATVLRDLDAARHVVPNGEVTVSTNFTKGFSRYLMYLPVPYGEDIDRAVDLVREVVEQMRREPDYSGLILGPLEVLGVDNYGDSQIDVRMYIETVPGKQWSTGRQLRRRIKMAYDRAGISIPFPHREIIIRPESAPLIPQQEPSAPQKPDGSSRRR